jgi:hypothetical protein
MNAKILLSHPPPNVSFEINPFTFKCFGSTCTYAIYYKEQSHVIMEAEKA